MSAKYKVWVPDGAVRYKAAVPCEVCPTPNIFASPNDFTTWTITGLGTITADQGESPGCGQDADEVYFDDHTTNFFIQIPGNTPDADVDLKFWMKLISLGGIPGAAALRVEHITSNLYGVWNIDLGHPMVIMNRWMLLDPSHPAVDESVQFSVDDTGNLDINIRSLAIGQNITAQFWCAYAQEI